ncbi:F-box/FBD/LRR-repeat protein At2g04230-like isoform X2 [Corylus avellana]|uniref:F-box/FBD/LRR-repeat protein At2g04230-like isoform X2 n=1 Tax=Corylus avellana TaxID=13451 RepID=UPI00286C229A|nr:F-box/FBD/LRR-repeat protein At2g04230-like isoform X2 [Corylus avellana]
METTCVIQKPQKKKQKLNEEEDIDGNSKSLGNLPEEILRHILSFLPTKDAVGTSLVSKRVLCVRDSSVINRFTLCCDVLHDASRVNTWISAAVRHNVQMLDIKLDKFKGEFSLPYVLFTCKTLKSLHLCMPCMLKLPTAICFSNLKILTIKNVTFSDECLTEKLFSDLPALEELQLHGCSWGDLKVVRISVPNLHFLSVKDFERPDSRNGKGCQVRIVGARLEEFHYGGLMFNEYRLFVSFKLKKAKIGTRAKNTSEQSAHRMHKLLTRLSPVQFLILSSDVVKVLINAEELLTNMPTFNNVKDLELNGTPLDLDCEALLEILQCFPRLENLKILREINLSSSCEEDERILCPMPPCFLSHLKWIKVNCYNGDEKKLSVIKIFLKKAIALEEVVISLENLGWNLEKQLKACKQLMELSRASQNCKIVLEWHDYSTEKECRIVL